ncbi:hypothetical protein AB0L42_45355 [Streptomyces sp. NPDC052287]
MGKPKGNTFRALLHTEEGRMVLRSRRGTETAQASIAAAAG